MRVLALVIAVASGCFASFLLLDAQGADRPLSIPIQITHAQNFDPSPSPDGKRLVYISVVSGKEQLFTMNVDGIESAQLTRDDADHEDPAWSPDGTRIAFVLIAGGHNRIAVMRPDGSNVEVLTPPEQNTIHPNWSSDSKQIIYCTNDDLQPPSQRGLVAETDVALASQRQWLAATLLVSQTEANGLLVCCGIFRLIPWINVAVVGIREQTGTRGDPGSRSEKQT